MNKKLVVSVLLCLFVFSLGALAEEKAKASIIEHLVWADTGNVFITVEIEDYTIRKSFETEPFLRFHVPASPKSEALFFDVFTQILFRWSDFEERRLTAVNRLRIISDAIPENITVFTGKVIYETSETNFTHNFSRHKERAMARCKFNMRRNAVDWWWVENLETGERVPDSEALLFWEKLIDNGFDVEVFAWGTTLGVKEYICFIPVTIEVTRLSKK